MKTIPFLLPFILIPALVQPAASQCPPMHQQTAIVVSDDHGNSDSLIFGRDIYATRGIDDFLGEYEAPPLPPSGFDARLISNRPSENTPQGGFTIDYLPFPTNPEIKDTFVIRFQNTDVPAANFKLSWDSQYVPLIWNRLLIKVPAFTDGLGDTTTLPRTIDMATVDSLVLVDPQEHNVTTLTIWAYGWICGDAVRSPSYGTHRTFSLSSPFPNPFNPSTQIRYNVSVSAHVVLKVFDMLGQEVRTLVDAFEHPGEKNVKFTAENLPTGVYFYRLQAGSYMDTKKLVLLR